MDPTDEGRLRSPLPEAAPPDRTTVTLARKIRAIHATDVWRRFRWTIVSAVVLGLVGFGIGALPGILDDLRGTPPHTPTGRFGLLRQEFTVGSAGGLLPVSYETGRYRQRMRLAPAPGTPGVPSAATVTLFAPGRWPGRAPVGTPVPDVDGKPAVRLDGPDGVRIAWEWSQGGWAFVHVHAFGTDADDLAHEVAQGVEKKRSTPVSLPFTVPELVRDGLELVGAIVPFENVADPVAGGLLVFGGHHSTYADDDPHRVLVGVRRDLTTDFVTGGPRAAPVAVAELDAGGGYTAVAESASPTTSTSRAGAVQVVADPADRREWTTDPLR